jgi:FAD synthetase
MKKIRVIVFGTFDLLHPGHLHLLKEAKEYGDYLIVVVARDNTVEEVKGKNAVNDEEARLENIKKLNIADKVRLGYLDDRYKVIAEENPDIIALGYDQKVFVDRLTEIIPDHTKIVRLTSHHPDKYKSSKLRKDRDQSL